MSTLLYGGAFNPITIAHILTAREAMERGGFSEVIVIPCGDGWHKGSDLLSFDHRLEMVKLAIKNQKNFDFSAVEGEWGKNGKKSYTIDTYRYMQKHIAGQDVWWLIGSDNIDKIPKWHNFEAIKKEMKFVVLPRPGYYDDPKNLEGDSAGVELAIMGLENRYTFAPLLEISSTYVRNRLKHGKPISYLVPDTVDSYIKEHGLYKPQSAS